MARLSTGRGSWNIPGMRWMLLLLAAAACSKRPENGSAAPEPAEPGGSPAAPSDPGPDDDAGEPGVPDPPPPDPPGDPALVKVPAQLALLVELKKVNGELNRPVGLEAAPGSGTIWVVEQVGRLRILRDGALVRRPALDIQRQVSRASEQGLLGLAFHPRFAANRKLYVHYTDGGGDTTIVEYQVAAGDPEQVDLTTARKLFELKQPFANHNGGYLEFAPDGKLYVGLGDGGAGGDPFKAGQDDRNLLAKMLRFDVDAPGKPEPEIVAKGLRNPWRYDFDDRTGDVYIADVGQDKYEEVDVVAAADLAGANFGWNVMEGNHCFQPRRGCDRTGLVLPVVEYPRREGCSITGGEVYQGKALPELDRVYFYADFCTGLVRSFRWSAATGIRDHWDWSDALNPGRRIKNISAFGHDAGGELYLLSLDGDVYKLQRR